MTQFQCFRIAFEFWAIIFGVIAAICVFATRSFERQAAITLTSMLAIDVVMNTADILLVLVISLDLLEAGWIVPRIMLVTVYACVFLFILYSTWHIERVIEVRSGHVSHRLARGAKAIACLGIASVLASRVFRFYYILDEQRGLCRLDSFPLLIALFELAMLPIIIQIVRNRKSLRTLECTLFLIAFLLVSIGFIVQLMYENYPCFHFTFALTLIMIVLTHQIEFAKDNLERERALARMQVHLYTRQIQPHFIYNSLSAIRSKLPEDSEARESLNHFAGFMRGSVDLLTAEGCIRASRELATVRDYLFMEQERFGDALCVHIDLADEDFALPPFTVQTLVENAIHYGIRENPDGRGTLTIRSYRKDATHVIEVIDDGAGFEAVMPMDDVDGRTHIGLTNIRRRLEMMCAGTLVIESAPGRGTRAIVEIPAERGEDR